MRTALRSFADRQWVDRVVRVGLAARAIVFFVLAYLVASIALGALGHGTQSDPANGPGIARAVVQQPAGRPLLFALAAGLALYAGFSALDTILHHNDESPAAKRWGDRALSAWGVIMYGVFSGYCFVTAFTGPDRSSTSTHDVHQKAQWTASVLRLPGGPVYLGLIGTILLLIAAFLVSRCARRSFRPRLAERRMRRDVWLIAMTTGVLGYLGRAALFGIVGWFVLRAAIEDDPSNGQGIDGSVRLLANSPGGPALLWVLAVLLGTYGLYLLVETRYRHV